MQLEEPNDLLNALVNLNDKDPLQFEPSERTERVDPLRYKSQELLEYLSIIKMGLEIIGKIKEGIGEWWKIKIPRERARFPVEAFGVLPFIPQFIKDKEK